MPHLTRQDCRSTCFSAPRFLNQTASRWLGCAFIAFSLLGGGLQTSKGELIILAEEVDENTVVFSWGGGTQFLTPPGGSFGTNPLSAGFINPSTGTFWAPGLGFGDLYFGVPFGTSFGTGGNANASSSSGSALAVDSGALYLDPGYSSGDTYPMGSMTFAMASFSTLGIDDSTNPLVLLSWGAGAGDQITMEFSPYVVPEPTTALGLLGLVTSAFFRRRRRLLG